MTDANPEHIGIIPDGNRRWAKERGRASVEGHKAGFDVFIDLWKHYEEYGVNHLTVFGMSTENKTKRSAVEVAALTTILAEGLKANLPTFIERGIRFRALGDRTKLASKLQKVIEEAEEATKGFDRSLNVAMNYGGRWEIAEAAKKLIEQGTPASDVTPELLAMQLQTAELPDLDIIVRTGKESRISNFLLWKGAYSEIFFLDKFWPDVTKEDVDHILEWYKEKQRRFGQ